MILITGGAGFIGSNFILDWFANNPNEKVINLDKLTYAGNLENLNSLINNNNYIFIKADITDPDLVSEIINKYKPRAIINFAAESHVDNSILKPEEFINTNIVGTFHLLQSARSYWTNLPKEPKANFRFLHISTDEVYGSLTKNEPAFTENSNYKPNSPYSASKAASDHLVRAYFHTYSLPTITTNCSNNYGAYQFPEKLIPLCIINALSDKPIPIYGNGKQIRDWLYVSDHCSAIRQVLTNGEIGQVYNIGGNNQQTNIEVVENICDILDKLKPKGNGESYKKLITYVSDRAGHDKRYAINTNKIQQKLNWQAKESFASGLTKTIKWYLNNQQWVKNITSGKYCQ